MIANVTVLLAVAVVGFRLRPRSRRDTPGGPRHRSRRRGLTVAWTAQHRKSRQLPARAVAGWCDDIARHIRSGSSLRNAITALPADVATEQATSAVRLSVERGLSVADAVGRAGDTGPHLRLALGVIATASRVGGPSGPSIEHTAALLRQRAADLDERSAHAAQARLSTHVMTAVPLLMLAVLVVADGDVRSAAASPAGAACIGVGLVLNVLGWCWMHRIVATPS